MGFIGWGKAFVNKEGWFCVPLGQSRYVCYYAEGKSKKLTIPAGGTLTEYCTIPFPFLFNKITFSWNDTTARSIHLSIMQSQLQEATYPIDIFEDINNSDTNNYVTFKENENEWDENDKIRIVITGTAAKTVFPAIYVKGLK